LREAVMAERGLRLPAPARQSKLLTPVKRTWPLIDQALHGTHGLAIDGCSPSAAVKIEMVRAQPFEAASQARRVPSYRHSTEHFAHQEISSRRPAMALP